jgi:hypothetical protein
MARPLTGTVTFLLTDIEGSTRLLLPLGNAYGELLRSTTPSSDARSATAAARR